MRREVGTEVRGRWHNRHLLCNGETVSRLSVLAASIWLFGIPVRMAGIGGVQTERQHRMKGHARHLLQDTVRYMTEEGFDVSVLFGIPDFYNKFGFIPCLPDHRISVATRDAERAGRRAGKYTTSPMSRRDCGFVVRLYNEDNRHRPAALVREKEHFSGFRKGTDHWINADAFVMRDERRRKVAYAAFDDTNTAVKVAELGAAEPAAHPALLCEFARMAIERRCGEIELHIPPDHAFARFVQRFGASVHTRYHRMGGGMMRILNQEQLFRKIEPALQDRFERSRLATRPVVLSLETDLGTTELHLGGASEAGRVHRCRLALGQGKLTQLTVGYRTADDVLSDPGVEAEGDLRSLLEALFGGQAPYMWCPDRF